MALMPSLLLDNVAHAEFAALSAFGPISPVALTMLMPEMKQIWDLSPSDFHEHPVWVGVHTFDIGKPWHKTANEATYRPWDQGGPAKSEKGLILVRAELEFQSKRVYPGFFTAVPETWDIPPRAELASISARYGGPEIGLVAVQQPRMFLNDQQFSFWGGRSGVPLEKRQDFYALLRLTQEDIFPIRFRAEKGLATGITAGEVKGFYRLIPKQPPQIEW